MWRAFLVALTACLPVSSEGFSLAESLAPAGAACSGTTTVDFSGGNYIFRCSSIPGAGYLLDVDSAPVRAGLLEVRELLTGARPVTGAGTRWRNPDGSVLDPVGLARSATTTFQHELLPGPIVRLTYSDTMGARTLQKRYDLELSGRTLIVHAYAVNSDSIAAGAYAGFAFGPSGESLDPREIIVPYLEAHPIVMAGPSSRRFFSSVYLDWGLSGSNAPKIRQGPSAPLPDSFLDTYASQYVPGEDGLLPVFDETAYITVSPVPVDVMLAIHRPPSNYRSMLNDRVIWDTYGYSLFPLQPLTDSYRVTKGILAQLSEFGMEKLAVIFHPWQYHGYDCGLPTHYPANPAYGGDADMRSLSASILAAGHLFALHENYGEIYANSEAYWSGGLNAARDPSGTKVVTNPARNCPSPTSYAMASDKMASFAAVESRLTKAAYGPNSGFIDVTTQISADYFVDYAAVNPAARTIRAGLANNLRLNRQAQSIYLGPLFGEGGSEPTRSMIYQAGTVDGVEAEITGREAAPLMPDFVLGTLKPLMANHGMGYGGRFVGPGPAQLTNLHPTTFPWDKYRAMQIAFGHAGFMHDATFGAPGIRLNDFYRYWVKEYYTFRALQADYLSSPVAEIRYEDDGGDRLTLGQALAANLDFTKARVYERYSSGLELVINHHPTSNWSVSLQGQLYVLPPEGWAAANPVSGLRNFSALVDAQGQPSVSGTRVDYVSSSEYIFIDGRGASSLIPFGLDFLGNPVSTTRMLVLKPGGWTLSEDSAGIFTVSTTAATSGTLVGRYDAGNSVMISGSLAGGRVVTLSIPDGAFTGPINLAIAGTPARTACSGSPVAVSVTTFPPAQPVRPLQLAVSFSPQDVVGMDMARLSLARFDPHSGQCVPLNSVVDFAGRTLTAMVNHLSHFQIVQTNGAARSEARAYPNPVHAATEPFVTVDRLIAGSVVRVYNLSAELVAQGQADAFGIWRWNLRNLSGFPVASGGYVIPVQAVAGRRTLKLSILR